MNMWLGPLAFILCSLAAVCEIVSGFLDPASAVAWFFLEGDSVQAYKFSKVEANNMTEEIFF